MSTVPSPPNPARKPSRWLALLSFLCALPGLLLPGLGIVAIVGGGFSLYEKKAGRKLAIAAIVLGCLGTLFSFFVVLPTYRMVIELQNKIVCGSNLYQIGQAINEYSNDNRGSLPPDLATLVTTVHLDPNALVCPSNDGRHPSYIYIGKGMGFWAAGDPIIAYDDPSNHSKHVRDGVNVLHISSGVNFISIAELQKTLAAEQAERNQPK